ncbi:MAG: hypothetical protein ACLPID_18005 [Beijerinckiaceae bacterium]|jgi:hypothetical protein
MIIERRKFLIALGGSIIASAAQAQGDDLGFEWRVHEEVPGGRFWEGTWRRRGRSDVFDARWRDSQSGGIVLDVIEIQSYDGSSITLYRRGNNGTYSGVVSHPGRSIRGTASWYPAGAFWTAQIRG